MHQEGTMAIILTQSKISLLQTNSVNIIGMRC